MEKSISCPTPPPTSVSAPTELSKSLATLIYATIDTYKQPVQNINILRTLEQDTQSIDNISKLLADGNFQDLEKIISEKN